MDGKKMSRTEYQANYYQQHREERLQYFREYREQNKERRSAWNKAYREHDIEAWNKKGRDYYKTSREKVLKRHQILRFKVLQKLGNKCVRCGFDDWRALQVDHVKNNGHEERKKLRPRELYEKILELPKDELEENYQLLCANCNWIKKYE